MRLDNNRYNTSMIDSAKVKIADIPDLKDLENGDILNAETLRNLYRIMEKQEILSKYKFPKQPSSDGFFHLYLADGEQSSGRRQIKAKTLNGLKEKVYQYESGIAGSTRKTFREAFELVQQEKPKYIKNPEKLLSVNNSIRRIRSEYKRCFAGSSFEEMFIDEITEKDIENFCYEITQRLDLRKKSLALVRSILKTTLDLAFRQRWIEENPYFRVDFDRFKYMLVMPTDISKRFHAENETDMILEYTHARQDDSPGFMAPFAFELQTIMGLREGEVPPLRWSDIRGDHILIHREQLMVKKGDLQSKQSCVIVEHTKTWKDRKYPITEELRRFLVRLSGVHERNGIRSEFLFPSKNDQSKPLHNHSIYNYYRTMCRKLGITLSHEAHKGPHSFRRNAITKAAKNSGGDMLMVSKIFGNTPAVAENNYYVGLSLDRAKAVLEME